MSVARLQQLLIFALITTVIAWLIFAAAYVPAFVVIGVAFAFAFGYAWVLAFEFALLLVYGAKHGGLRPTLVQVIRAWGRSARRAAGLLLASALAIRRGAGLAPELVPTRCAACPWVLLQPRLLESLDGETADGQDPAHGPQP